MGPTSLHDLVSIKPSQPHLAPQVLRFYKTLSVRVFNPTVGSTPISVGPFGSGVIKRDPMSYGNGWLIVGHTCTKIEVLCIMCGVHWIGSQLTYISANLPQVTMYWYYHGLIWMHPKSTFIIVNQPQILTCLK